MVFEAGKNNLRDIHRLMTQIENTRLEADAAMCARNAIIKNHIIQLVKRPPLTSLPGEKTTYSLRHIEADLSELRFEIAAYKHNLQLSKMFFSEFKALKASFLK